MFLWNYPSPFFNLFIFFICVCVCVCVNKTVCHTREFRLVSIEIPCISTKRKTYILEIGSLVCV